MDNKFHSATAAIDADDLDQFRTLVGQDPSLATTRSSTSHPTLLQCVVLAGGDKPNNVAMAQVLVDAGAEFSERGVGVDGDHPVAASQFGSAIGLSLALATCVGWNLSLWWFGRRKAAP